MKSQYILLFFFSIVSLSLNAPPDYDEIAFSISWMSMFSYNISLL